MSPGTGYRCFQYLFNASQQVLVQQNKVETLLFSATCESPALLSRQKQLKVPSPTKPVHLVPTLENPARKAS